MEFVSHGKSGCGIEIINQNFDFFLRKTSKTIEENSRHVERAHKQVSFYKENAFAHLKAPQITKIFPGSESELSYIEMKYIAGRNSLNFLKEADTRSVDYFIKILTDYLDTRFMEAIEKGMYSGNEEVDYIKTIQNKAEQVSKLIFPRKEIIMDKLRNLPKNAVFLQGKCHGDLTLTNMIHTKSTIYVIDFLDVFIDSPILDLLSIRQDTHHLWSCFIYNDYTCRVVELLKYIDEKLKQKYAWVINNNWYNYLSLMNYVRMYRMYEPNSEARELNFIYNCISEYL